MALTNGFDNGPGNNFSKTLQERRKNCPARSQAIQCQKLCREPRKNGFRTGRPDRSSAEIGVDGAQGHARGNFSICHTIKMITFKHCRIFANATNLPLSHICQYYSLVSMPGRCNHLNGENSRKTPFLRGEVVRDKTCISALLLKHSQNSTWFNFLLYDKCELRFAET